MVDADDGATTIPAIWLEPADIRILKFLRRRGPTYHINIARELPADINLVSRRCKDLATHGLLDRQSRTYYGLTEEAHQFLVGDIDMTELGTNVGAG